MHLEHFGNGVLNFFHHLQVGLAFAHCKACGCSDYKEKSMPWTVGLWEHLLPEKLAGGYYAGKVEREEEEGMTTQGGFYGSPVGEVLFIQGLYLN